MLRSDRKGLSWRRMNITEMIAEARGAVARPGEDVEDTRACALVRIAAREGVPFRVEHVRDLGPCAEAGCSPFAREERITFRLPDGGLSGGWCTWDVLAPAAKMLREWYTPEVTPEGVALWLRSRLTPGQMSDVVAHRVLVWDVVTLPEGWSDDVVIAGVEVMGMEDAR